MAFHWLIYFNPYHTPNLFPLSVFWVPCSIGNFIPSHSFSAFKYAQVPPPYSCYLQSSSWKHWPMFILFSSSPWIKCCFCICISGKLFFVIFLVIPLNIFKSLSQLTCYWIKMVVFSRILFLAEFSFCLLSPGELTNFHSFNY